MNKKLEYWVSLYERLKFSAYCIDIETTKYKGPVSVVGTSRPCEGLMDYESFVKGKNLTKINLKKKFADCKLIIVFNGLRFDLPKIEEEFGKVFPEGTPVFDIYPFARAVGVATDLKSMESKFDVFRLNKSQKEKGKTAGLWWAYKEKGNIAALNKLIGYNRQDTINLYPLAEAVIKHYHQYK